MNNPEGAEIHPPIPDQLRGTACVSTATYQASLCINTPLHTVILITCICLAHSISWSDQRYYFNHQTWVRIVPLEALKPCVCASCNI